MSFLDAQSYDVKVWNMVCVSKMNVVSHMGFEDNSIKHQAISFQDHFLTFYTLVLCISIPVGFISDISSCLAKPFWYDSLPWAVSVSFPPRPSDESGAARHVYQIQNQQVGWGKCDILGMSSQRQGWVWHHIKPWGVVCYLNSPKMWFIETKHERVLSWSPSTVVFPWVTLSQISGDNFFFRLVDWWEFHW